MTELDRIRDRYRPTNELALDIMGVRLAVRTNHGPVASWLARYFHPYVTSDAAPDAPTLFVLQGDPVLAAARLRDVTPAGAGKVPKEAFYDTPAGRIVLKRRTGMAIYVAEPDHFVVGDVARNLHQVVNAVSMIFAKTMLRRGYLMLHASAVLGAEGGVGFSARSGTGKSTMALALMERGYRFITNDRLLVRPVSGSAEMAGLPKLPRVNPGTLLKLPSLRRMVSPQDRERYERLSPATLWAVEEKRDVDVDGVFGRGTRQVSGILRVLYVLHWDPGGTGWDVRPLDATPRLAELRRLLKGLGVFDPEPAGAGQQAALEAIADAVAVYEVVGRADVLKLREFILDRVPADPPGAPAARRHAPGAASGWAPPPRRGRGHKEDRFPDGKGLQAVTTRETFDRDLAQLQEDLLRMGGLVQAALRRSIEALQARSVALADEVISGDNATDALHLELEERCLQLMATQQPMAKDLRMIAAVWAMSIDLERMGDHAEDIARVTRRIAEQPLLKPLMDIPRMADLVSEMLREGLDAFVARDAARAERMAAKDDAVDHLYAQVFRELLTYMLEDPKNTQRATQLLMVAQALERMGDHATNIAERVIYMVTGTLRELNV